MQKPDNENQNEINNVWLDEAPGRKKLNTKGLTGLIASFELVNMLVPSLAHAEREVAEASKRSRGRVTASILYEAGKSFTESRRQIAALIDHIYDLERALEGKEKS